MLNSPRMKILNLESSQRPIQISIIDALLGEMNFAHFMTTHYRRSPLAVTGTADCFKWQFNWKRLEDILKDPTENRFIPEIPELVNTRFSFSEFKDLFARGHSLLVRQADKMDKFMMNMAIGFQARLKTPVEVELYVSPAHSELIHQADDTDGSFIIQTQGTADLLILQKLCPLYGDQPKIHNKLNPGDCIYIPAGYGYTSLSPQDSFQIAIRIKRRIH